MATNDPNYDPTTDTSSADTSPAAQGWGNPIYDQIGAYMTNVSGGKLKPTYADVSQWGTNVDSNYMNTIQGAIRNSWAQQQAQAPPPAAAPTTPPPAATATPAAASPTTAAQTPVGSQNPQGLLQGNDFSGLQGLMQQQLAMQQQQMASEQAMRDQFRQSILGQLGTLQNDKTATDPNGAQLAPIINAYHLQSQRGLDRTRNAIAEANYANGTLNSGGFQSQEQGALENAGAQEANFTGQQVSQAVAQRQQQLQHLLDVGAGFLSQGDQQAVQTELAQLQAQMQQQQLGYNYAQLGQQNNQYNAGLGYNYTALQAQMNQQALLQAMGY